ncbi:MAG: hypothetical protein ACYTEX_20330 [Planctomycetota bacterium]|jgi:hypothetical protein
MKERSVVIVAMGVLLAVPAGTIWAGTYSGGDGSPENPYRIATAEDLNDIGNHPNDLDKHFVLVNDINLSAYTGSEFNMIGHYYSFFTGVFDGNGHTVANFSYVSGSPLVGVGLFSVITDGGQVKNLGLVEWAGGRPYWDTGRQAHWWHSQQLLEPGR